MADYSQEHCDVCDRVTVWRYPDDETPNIEIECTQHEEE